MDPGSEAGVTQQAVIHPAGPIGNTRRQQREREDKKMGVTIGVGV